MLWGFQWEDFMFEEKRFFPVLIILPVFLSLILLFACESDSEPEMVDDEAADFNLPPWNDNKDDDVDDNETDRDPVARSGPSGPLASRLNKEMDKHYAGLMGMTYQELLDIHSVSYLENHGLDIEQAEYYTGFIQSFDLSDKALEVLEKKGFVVITAPEPILHLSATAAGPGPSDVYYRLFSADLPVFVSADSILHAWHSSFDSLLMESEVRMMIPSLNDLLDKTLSVLDLSRQDHNDAAFYLTVARRLLNPESEIPEAVESEVRRYLDLISEKQFAGTQFMGNETHIDFSQFIPRGHYTRSESLRRYFMSMMWLGRTDLVLYSKCTGRPREEAAARVLAGAMKISGAENEFDRMDSLYEAYVGDTNALTPKDLLELCEANGLPACSGDPGNMLQAYKNQPPPEYSSRAFADNPFPISMRFFPQRFAYDSWVTTRTTYPRLKPAGRGMAMPEDVAFVLGSDRSLKYFEEEMKNPSSQNLPATLEAARRTIGAIPPTELENTVYNQWLEALMALSEPTVELFYPKVMRTADWHDRKLEAVFSSWTEMRHDTILIVEQSAGGGCIYPMGYVEPVPDLFNALAGAADRLKAAYSDKEDEFGNVPAFYDHWKDILSELGGIVDRELEGKPLTSDQLAFLNELVDEYSATIGSGGDTRYFNGWYPRLYWNSHWGRQDFEYGLPIDQSSAFAQPVVADVHTDLDTYSALEVATGVQGLMVVAIDHDDRTALYGGPVSSFYSFHAPMDERMTDEQWIREIISGDIPSRPGFSAGYWVE